MGQATTQASHALSSGGQASGYSQPGENLPATSVSFERKGRYFLVKCDGGGCLVIVRAKGRKTPVCTLRTGSSVILGRGWWSVISRVNMPPQGKGRSQLMAAVMRDALAALADRQFHGIIIPPGEKWSDELSEIARLRLGTVTLGALGVGVPVNPASSSPDTWEMPLERSK